MSFIRLPNELQEIILSQVLIHPVSIKLAHPKPSTDQPSTDQTEVMSGPTTPQTVVADFNNLRITCRQAYSACSRIFFTKNDFVVSTLNHLKHIRTTLPERDLDLITRLCCMRDVWVPTHLRVFTDRPTIQDFFGTLAHFRNVNVISLILPWQFYAYEANNARPPRVGFKTFIFELADRLPQSPVIRILLPEELTGVHQRCLSDLFSDTRDRLLSLNARTPGSRFRGSIRPRLRDCCCPSCIGAAGAPPSA